MTSWQTESEVIIIDGIYRQKTPPSIRGMKREQKEQYTIFSPKNLSILLIVHSLLEI